MSRSRKPAAAPPPKPVLPDTTELARYFERHPEETLLTVSGRSSEFDGTPVDPAMISKFKNAALHLRQIAATGTGHYSLPNALTADRIEHGTGGEVAAASWQELRRCAASMRKQRRTEQRATRAS